MIRPDEAKSALVSYLKSKPAIYSELPEGTDEIREVEWQGTEFAYPNIRVRLIRMTPTNTTCSDFELLASIYVFSEEASSYQADKIIGIINDVLHRRSFTSNGVRFVLHATSMNPAVREDRNTWRSELLLSGNVNLG